MRGWLIAAATFALVGCASPLKGPATPPSKQLAEIQWPEFAGMTQDDLRERVGLPPTGRTLASKAHIEDGKVASEVWIMHVLLGACRDAPDGYRGMVDISHNNARLQMAGDRIAGFDATRSQYGPAADAEHPFVVSCRYSRKATFADTMKDGQAGAIVVLPLAPVVLASKSIGEAAESNRYAAFAELRLGEPPPGGLNAWLGRHKAEFKASSPKEDEVEIRFNVGDQSAAWQPAAAHFRDGKAVELNVSAGACVLRDRSLDCNTPR
jgi:hypothetical protein